MVAHQLEKDLDLKIGLNLSGDADQAYRELYHQVLPILKERTTSGLYSFKQLMYRIDISEKKVAQEFAKSVNPDEFEIYTNLIIERELQKVVTRLYFSQKLDS